ncbi:hypothetical protein CRUP_029526, partial [Coryphaenoides rupestris]
MAQEGWMPLMCVGLRSHWENVYLQDMQDSYGQEWQYTCYTVFFVSIEICQISDVLIRKTRRLSVFQQGFFRNKVLVSAIVFQLCLGNLLCYCPGMPNIFNFMPIRVQWWFVPVPYGILIFVYDEIRKAAEDVAVLGGAERVDGVRVGLELLLHRVAPGVQHQNLAPQLAVTQTPEGPVARATNPDL